MDDNDESDDNGADPAAELDEALFALEELIAESPVEALSMFETLPDGVRALPQFRLSRARGLQANGDLAKARDLCVAILAEPHEASLDADLHHLLGDLLEDLGQGEEANTHFLATLRADRAAFEEARHLSADELKSRLSELFARALSNYERDGHTFSGRHTVLLFPSEQGVLDGLDPRAFCGYFPSGDGLIEIYAANLDAEYGDLDELGEFDEHVVAELEQQLNEHLHSQG